MRKKKKPKPEKLPLDKKKQALVNKIRKEKAKKDEQIIQKCKKDESHKEFWTKEKELGKPIQEVVTPPQACTVLATPPEEFKPANIEITAEKPSLWKWFKSLFGK